MSTQNNMRKKRGGKILAIIGDSHRLTVVPECLQRGLTIASVRNSHPRQLFPAHLPLLLILHNFSLVNEPPSSQCPPSFFSTNFLRIPTARCKRLSSRPSLCCCGSSAVPENNVQLPPQPCSHTHAHTHTHASQQPLPHTQQERYSSSRHSNFPSTPLHHTTTTTDCTASLNRQCQAVIPSELHFTARQERICSDPNEVSSVTLVVTVITGSSRSVVQTFWILLLFARNIGIEFKLL